MIHGSTSDPAATHDEASGGGVSRHLQREYLKVILDRGLDSCRQGNWKEGLVDLAWLAESQPTKELPGLCYSYLGYGLARYQGQVENGLRLCRHAVAQEFYQPENYLNLARTALLKSKYRREAFEAVREGLKVDPESPELLALHRELGLRRKPVLPFLARTNPINRICGWFRHQLSPPKPAEEPENEEPRADPSTVITTVA